MLPKARLTLHSRMFGSRRVITPSWLSICEVKAKVVQPCPTLCIPMDSTVLGILQARILEWVAFPFSTVSICSNHLIIVEIFYEESFTIYPRITEKETEVPQVQDEWQSQPGAQAAVVFKVTLHTSNQQLLLKLKIHRLCDCSSNPKPWKTLKVIP